MKCFVRVNDISVYEGHSSDRVSAVLDTTQKLMGATGASGVVKFRDYDREGQLPFTNGQLGLQKYEPNDPQDIYA
jgi:hypothetical protein